VTPIGYNSIWDYVLRKQVHRDRHQRSQIRKTEKKGVSGFRNEEQLILGTLKEIIRPVLSDPDFQSAILSHKYEPVLISESISSDRVSSLKQSYSKMPTQIQSFNNKMEIFSKHSKAGSFDPPEVELELSRIQHQKVGGNKVENVFNIQHEKLNTKFLKTPDKSSCCCLTDSDNIKLSARLKKSSSYYTQNISGAVPCLCNCGGHKQRSEVRNILRGMQTNKLKISVRL
jgi:hypothetical protein